MFCVFFGYLKRGRGCAAGAAEDHMKRSNHASTYFEKSHRRAPPRFEVPFNKARFPFLAKTGFKSSDSVRYCRQNRESQLFNKKVTFLRFGGTLLDPFWVPFWTLLGSFWTLLGSFWTLLGSLGPPWVPLGPS